LPSFGFNTRVPGDICAEQAADIAASHCGMLDAETAGRMVGAQMARHQFMSRTIEANATHGAVPIAGNRYGRRDGGAALVDRTHPDVQRGERLAGRARTEPGRIRHHGVRYEERLEQVIVTILIAPRRQRLVTAARPAYLANLGRSEHPRGLSDRGGHDLDDPKTQGHQRTLFKGSASALDNSLFMARSAHASGMHVSGWWYALLRLDLAQRTAA